MQSACNRVAYTEALQSWKRHWSSWFNYTTRNKSRLRNAIISALHFEICTEQRPRPYCSYSKSHLQAACACVVFCVIFLYFHCPSNCWAPYVISAYSHVACSFVRVLSGHHCVVALGSDLHIGWCSEIVGNFRRKISDNFPKFILILPEIFGNLLITRVSQLFPSRTLQSNAVK